jgi:GNAT superfamily N-acetyltransferase
MTHVRPAVPGDAEALAALLAAYLGERFPGHPGTTAGELRRDVLGDSGSHRVLLGERDGRALGFVAWDDIYDMHWAARGALVADLYVEPGSRGHGVALALLAGVCAHAAEGGARFVRGGGYDPASATGRFYQRLAVGFPTMECNCSGRAFRRVAALHGAPIRQMIRSLPPVEWNHEA